MRSIKIYTSPNCPYCRVAKKFLDEHGAEYREINVREDQIGYEMMVAKSHQSGVPVIELEKEVFVGFNRKTMLKRLNLTPKETLFSKIKNSLTKTA